MRSSLLVRSLVAFGGATALLGGALPAFADTTAASEHTQTIESISGLPPAAEVTADEAEQDAAPEFTFFRMADGRFFHPGSGKVADSEQALHEAVFGPAVGDVSSAVVTGGMDAPAAAIDPLLAAMRRAQAELHARIDADKAGKPAKIAKDPEAPRELTLAIWNKASDQIRYVQVRKNGADLKVLEGGNGDSIKVAVANGINSEMIVNGGGEDIVVATRFPVYRPTNAAQTVFAVEDEVYVPYSRYLRTPAVVEEGERYLDELATRVFDRLRVDGIKSRVFPDKLVADLIDPAVVKSIAAIEHLDESSLQEDTGQALERFFVIIGANRGEAYNYSRSSANALGLVQFIPSTYNALAKRTSWKLRADFETGMQDHENAMRAEVLYLDELLYELPDSAQAQFLADTDKVNEFIVAAYNGGSGRVSRAMKTWEQIFTGEKQRQISKLQSQYDAAFSKAESLRQQTLKEKNKTKRAALQKQLDAQRAVYRGLASQVSALQNSILRKETIGYIQKYRLTTADERFTPRTITTVTASYVLQKAL